MGCLSLQHLLIDQTVIFVNMSVSAVYITKIPLMQGQKTTIILFEPWNYSIMIAYWEVLQQSFECPGPQLG